MRIYPTPQGTITKFGYCRITCKDRKQRFQHVLVWEEHYGPVPTGFEIHHKNHNKLDNRIENLKLITRLEHKRLHSGCVRFGDDWLKRCKRCRWYRSVNQEYYQYPGRSGVMTICRRCAIDLAVENKRKRRQRRLQQNTLRAAG